MIETISRRFSCRTYSDRPVEKREKERLKTFLAANTGSPFSSEVRFGLIDLHDPEKGEIRKLGTYGVIKGAKMFMAGVVRDRPKAMEDFGYCMEKAVLEATAIGLGTCWLGGTFSRSGFAEAMGLMEGELLPAVSPVGYAADRKSLTDRFFRFSAGSENRKPWNELFFDGRIGTPLDPESAGVYASPLSCIRRGPSASNKQPWRVVRDGKAFHFFLNRTPGYSAIFGKVKLQNIDMGIAMCHFELSAAELGLKGTWHEREPDIGTHGMEYIASWVPGA